MKIEVSHRFCMYKVVYSTLCICSVRVTGMILKVDFESICEEQTIDGQCLTCNIGFVDWG